eukprot:COSAG02_NODE_1705_length_11236_cov_6.168178_10_plen_495_part_00
MGSLATANQFDAPNEGTPPNTAAGRSRSTMVSAAMAARIRRSPLQMAFRRLAFGVIFLEREQSELAQQIADCDVLEHVALYLQSLNATKVVVRCRPRILREITSDLMTAVTCKAPHALVVGGHSALQMAAQRLAFATLLLSDHHSEPNASVQVFKDCEMLDRVVACLGDCVATRVEPFEDVDRHFAFEAVCDECAQQATIFREVSFVVDAFLNGNSGAILAFGQTGAGKTFTMFGTDDYEHPELLGIVPRTFFRVFEWIQQSARGGDGRSIVYGSMIQICNGQVQDLLDNTTSRIPSRKLRSQQGGGVYVENLVEQILGGPQDAAAMVEAGLQRRHTDATHMGRGLFDTDLVLTIRIVRKLDCDAGGKECSTTLQLCDLAGSERRGKTAHFERIPFNKSVVVLRQVMGALAKQLRDSDSRNSPASSSTAQKHSRRVFVPWRDSALTRLLQESFSCNPLNVAMVANIGPCAHDMSETMNTLHFAQIVADIRRSAS